MRWPDRVYEVGVRGRWLGVLFLLTAWSSR